MNEETYQNLLRKIGVIEVRPIKKDFSDNHFAIVCKMGTENVLLKNISKSYQKKLDSFRKEIKVEEILASSSFSSSFKRVQVLKDGEDEENYWVIRQYIDGDSLARYDNSKNITLFGYDKIEDEYLANKTEIIKKVAENILNFQKIDAKNVQNWPNRYEKDLNNYDIKGMESWLGFSLEKALGFYHNNSTNYFSEKNLKASIGDLLPANLIIDTNSEIFFSDMEWFSRDNYMVDISFFWLFLWRYPDLQKEFLSILVKTDEDKDNFRASIIRQIIGWYQKILKANKDDELKAYKKHIWARYLSSANESFEAIINTK